MTDYVTRWYKDQKNKYKENSDYKSAKKWTWAGSIMVMLGSLCGIFAYVDSIVKHAQYDWIIFLIAALVLILFGIGVIWIVNDDLRIDKKHADLVKSNFQLQIPYKSGKMDAKSPDFDTQGTIASYIALNSMLKQDPNLVVDRVEVHDNYDEGEPTYIVNAHSQDGNKQYKPSLKIMPISKVVKKNHAETAHVNIEGAKQIKHVKIDGVDKDAED